MAQTPEITGREILPIADIPTKGKISWVRIDLEEDNVSHLEPDELKCHRALARQ